MAAIAVKNLKKYYRVFHKEPGLKGSLKSLIKRKYVNVKAVDGINFSIDEGELVGFIGPNGAGKTTTLKCLSGLLYPTAGEVTVLDYEPKDRKNEFKKQISLVMGQKNQLWWDLPAQETFRLNKEIYEVPEKQYRETLNELVELLDIGEILDVQVRKLSLGQRMKCELIASLLHQPKVLFLDEPTIGLDVVMQKKIRDFIQEYNKRYKATIILTSHYMEDVRSLCERVIMINKGALAFDGPVKKLITDHATYKILVVIFGNDVKEKDLEKIGKVTEFTPHKAIIQVPRKEATERAAKLLSEFPVDDLSIDEPHLEEIIRKIFNNY
ncbi:MAG: ATP-binding cassette domain-containing protein [Patescibacteria group bacterium]|nr:ATP-binding cassette domain-containing protein [Patescibacteria group bacterium]